MKHSGVEWIGEIPDGWVQHPVYSYFSERKSPNILLSETNLLSLSYGKIKRKDINTNGGLLPASFNTYNIIEAGDIIIRPTDLQNDKRSLRTALSTERGIITSAYIALRPKHGVNSSYFHYLLHAYDVQKVFYNMGNGVRQGLNYSEFSKLMLIVPPDAEQCAIAAYLDAKCGEIEGLAEDIRAEIATLEEYKKSLITEAVTKGIRGDRPMKDSGVEWIGEIPEEWEIKYVKYLFEIVKRIAGKEGFDILSVTQKGLKVKDITNGEGQIAENYRNYQYVYPNDFVMNHMDLLTGWVDLSRLFGVTSPDYRVFRLRSEEGCCKEFYKYVMQNCYLHRIFYSLGQGVSGMGRWRLQTPVFNNFPVPLPPTCEQAEIAAYLDSKCAEIDSCIELKQEQLDTLAEYKKSLIYEYVTGKKEVPTP